MKLTNIAVISMMSLLVLACGGGGGASPTPTPVVAVEEPVIPVVDQPIVIVVVEPEPELELDPNAIYDKTADLIAAKSFLLEQEYELAVSYNNDDNRSAYLSVCTDFTEEESGIKVNYNSCLLRTSIENDYAGTLTVANDQNRLVMAIWYLDDAENPRYEVWENDSAADAVRNFDVN
jgi:hypothetical protein